MHIVIVEDEPVIVQRLQRLLGDILQDRPHQFSCFEDIDDAELFISEHAIDLLLLDLNLNGADGFELLKMLCAQSFQTIIVSAYAEQAIRAFDFGVLDFVVKPFNIDRLRLAINRYLSINQGVFKANTKLSVKKSDGFHLIEVDEIVYVKADGHYTQLYLTNKTTHLFDKTIDKLEKLLPNKFVKVHRSYMVNLNQVSQLMVEPGGRYHLLLHNDSQIPVSRSKYPYLRDILNIN